MKNRRTKPNKDKHEIKTFLRQRVHSQDVNLVGCEDKRQALYNAIVKSIQTGESNSLLLIGPPSSGKTILLHTILKKIDQDPSLADNILKVELNGLIHTDDKLSLQAISYQLCKQSLDSDSIKTRSFAENLAFILKSLKSGSKENKCILFILEKFELLAQHKSQMLLYNLYDIAQSSQTPMFILGLTCRFDALDLLEKRVKSRFSHRKLYIFNEINLEGFISYAKELLKLPTSYGSEHLRWNKYIEELFKDKRIFDVFYKTYNFYKDFYILKQLLNLILSRLNTRHYYLDADDFMNSYTEYFVDPKMTILVGLSLLEIGLIIAMMKLTVKYKLFNFEMTFEEYNKYTSKHPTTLQQFDKDVVYKAYEHLKAMEIIKISERSAQLPRHLLVRLQLDSEQIMKTLENYPNLPTALYQWANASVDD